MYSLAVVWLKPFIVLAAVWLEITRFDKLFIIATAVRSDHGCMQVSMQVIRGFEASMGKMVPSYRAIWPVVWNARC